MGQVNFLHVYAELAVDSLIGKQPIGALYFRCKLLSFERYRVMEELPWWVPFGHFLP